MESGGAKLAFVLPDQHPSHLAFRVDAGRSWSASRPSNGVAIATHRDATRSIYLAGPGALATEIIAYPATDDLA